VTKKSEGRVSARKVRGGKERAPLPLIERLDADTRFSGRGVVAAFIDSGFYAHQDLMEPDPRILAYEDIIHGQGGVDRLRHGDNSSWHGMMTTVVAAGNGHLSNGHFRSLAPEMRLVLVKAGTLSRVHHDDIARAIEWVLVHRAEFGIRILNVSCGGDYEASYLSDTMSRFAEACVRAGIVVVAAVGNSGHRPGYVVPPASVPAVISVGGLDDEGNPHLGRISGYRSSFGPTIDGIQKPEVITLADWIPAPILPDTPTHRQALLLRKLESARDDEVHALIHQNHGVFAPLDAARDRPVYLVRQVVAAALHDEKVVHDHYKMVDGTSFAAPIVTSVVAQMLEANPNLHPAQVKRILVQTAKRVPSIDWERQGYGHIQPKAAVQAALEFRT
jgi:serine protease AprX